MTTKQTVATRPIRVGDRVLVIAGLHKGEETTVLDIRAAWNDQIDGDYVLGETICVLDLHPYSPMTVPCAPPHYLRHLYDGDEVVSWEKCAWQPDKETT